MQHDEVCVHKAAHLSILLAHSMYYKSYRFNEITIFDIFIFILVFSVLLSELESYY
jgi:hypothetical protein